MPADNPEDRQSSRLGLPTRGRLGLAILGLAAVFFAIFVALGIWQIERRAWKLDLIAAIEERTIAIAVEAPGSAAWPSLSVQTDEYRHVTVHGWFRPDVRALVQATTDYGFGYWLMVPLRTDRGFTVLVNRGFVPSREAAVAIAPPEGEMAVTGLLRMSQPGGGFLRANDPDEGRWYSRDVEAIAEATGLSGPVAPYFIDVEASAKTGTPNASGASNSEPRYPIGGLTVTSFRNSHLVYALTWFGLALLTLVAAAIVYRRTSTRP